MLRRFDGMARWQQAALIGIGHVLAVLGGCAAVQVAGGDDAGGAQAGMAAFGDALLFLGVCALLAAPFWVLALRATLRRRPG